MSFLNSELHPWTLDFFILSKRPCLLRSTAFGSFRAHIQAVSAFYIMESILSLWNFSSISHNLMLLCVLFGGNGLNVAPSRVLRVLGLCCLHFVFCEASELALNSFLDLFYDSCAVQKCVLNFLFCVWPEMGMQDAVSLYCGYISACIWRSNVLHTLIFNLLLIFIKLYKCVFIILSHTLVSNWNCFVDICEL